MSDKQPPVPLTEELHQAYAFVDSMRRRADGHANGFYPWWHGWALREAYLAGWKAALEARSQETTPHSGVEHA